MPKNKRSFFERLTGNAAKEEEDLEKVIEECDDATPSKGGNWAEEEEEGQLSVDMFSSPSEIVIKAMIADVKPEDLDVSVTKEMITIKGHRQKEEEVSEDNYYYKELYWGGFSRSILLPQEVDSDNAEASVKNGLLIVKLPKINREKTQKLKIKSE